MKFMLRALCSVLLPVVPVLAAAEQEDEIPLADVPEVVIKAARDSFAGIELMEAEVISDGQVITYEIEGSVDGRELELMISASGELLGIEEDD